MSKIRHTVLLFLLLLITDCNLLTRTDEDVAIDLGASLEATFDDPILLTVAAARQYAGYMIDEGYTLSRIDGSVPAFVTDTSGDLGLAFEVDGRLIDSEESYHRKPVIEHRHH